MLSLPSQSGHTARVPRHWKTAVAADAAGLAIADAFVADRQPNGLTVVYAATAGDGRNHGARAGLVRRVIGSQWHPVPALQALAAANRIEAYSLPAGVINRLFRDIAGGLPGHLSRSGLGTSTDPRNGGGRLNTRTREQLVRLVRPAGDEALLFRGFPIDVALIGVAFMEESAAIAMTRESLTLARAARVSGGLVIAQIDHVGTMDKLAPGQVVAPDTLVDILIETDPRERRWETFAPAGRQAAETH